MDLYSYLARPHRLGLGTALLAGLMVLVLCLSFEFLVPTQTVTTADYLGQKNLNLRSTILYATAGGVHILLCIAGTAFFLAKLKASKLDFRNIIISIFVAFLLLFAAVLVACVLDIDVVRQSYHERVGPLREDVRLHFLLPKKSSPPPVFEFHLFAVFPLLLVAFGLVVAIAACFWISHEAIAFASRADALKKQEIVELKRSIAQLIGLTSIIFTTSTIATIAVMQIGRDWIEKGSARDAYIQNGHAMSIFWSTCYTTVIAAIVFIPLCWIAGQTRRIERQARFVNRRTFYDQIYDVISYQFVSQAGAAMLGPVLTSSLAALFAS
jgi:hypothetical protein